MNGRSIQHSKNSPSSRRRQRLPTPVLLAACLSLFASSGQAYPRTSTLESGLVIESLSATSTLSLSGLQTGDVIRHWEPLLPHLKAERQPYSTFDWFWFTNELLPRCPVRVTFEREEKFFDTIIFQGTIGARVRPLLAKPDLLFYIRFSQLLSNNSASEAARLAEGFFDQQRGKVTDLLSWASFLAATAYEQSKDLPKAIEWYVRAIDSTQDPLEQIYIWQSIGIVHQGARQTREAEGAYKRALAISQTSWPGSLIETTSIRALYLLAWESRDAETVRTYVLRETEILAREAPNSLKLADSWNMLGVLVSRAGDNDQAKAYHQQALALRRAIVPESRDTARSLINLGNHELLAEDYASGRSLYLEALAILQRAAPDSPEVSPLYANLGRVESALGHLAEAESMYRKAMEHTGRDEVHRISTIRSLSYLAQKRGDFIQAEEWSLQAVEALEKQAPHSSEMADTLSSLASIRYHMGDLDRAKDLFESALAINQKIGKEELDLASGLTNLASVLKRKGDFAGAEASWNKALEIFERRMPDGLSAARVLHNLGELKKIQRDPEAAIKLFRRALSIEIKLAPSSTEAVMTLWQLGSTLGDLGRDEEALTLHTESVSIAQRVPLAESVQAQALHEKSITLRRLARPNQALDSLREAVDLLEAQTYRIAGTDDNRTQFRSRFSDIYRDYIHTLVDQGEERAAFEIQELFLARSLAALFAERELIFRDVPPELEASRVRLAAEYDLVQRKLVEAYQAKSNDQVEDLTRKLRDVRDRQNTAISMLRRSSPHLASLRHPTPLNVEKAQKSLDTGTLALSFDVNKEASLLFALGPEGTLRVSRLDIGSEKLRREVGQFVELLREPTMALRRDSLLMKAQHLYREIFGSVDDLIAHSRRIILIPDGPLHALPFAALVRDSDLSDEESWQFLAEYKPLHIVSSLTTHSLQRTLHGRYSDAGAREDLVAFGDPAYPSGISGQSPAGDPYIRAASTLSSLEPLPWSRREVERIVDLFPGRSSLYLGNQATERAAKTTLARDKHRYVHFAGHGYLDQQFPLNSAVVLTMPTVFQSGEENGLLQTWEVLEQVRLDADLVVLSACESGLGKEMGGEGLIGLTRAFQYAGARSVMASLWKISDRTTAEFMVRFYRHLKEGLSKDEALRVTQMEFIRGPIQVTNEKGERVDFDASAPYYWAAFQIYGDWQ